MLKITYVQKLLRVSEKEAQNITDIFKCDYIMFYKTLDVYYLHNY
jgi:hypothetical protein